jgi:hypothetical protein
MEEVNPNVFNQSSDLNNTGWSISRHRSEKINEYYLSGKESTIEQGCYTVKLPEDIDDIEHFLLQLARKIGWKGWKEINHHLMLPHEKLVVFPWSENTNPDHHSIDGFIKSAIVLSMCNPCFYLPEGPRIFTRTRLGKSIRLLKINTTNFYEMD